MAGTKNLFNSSVEEMLREVIRLRHGIRVDPDYIDVRYDDVSDTQVSVILTPTARNGQYFYGQSQLVLDKVDLANHRPAEIWYSGTYPITFERLQTAMANSYGLIIRPGEWSVTQQGTTQLVDENMLLDKNIANDATFVIRPSVTHPIIRSSYYLYVRITTRDTMMLRVGGNTVSNPGVSQTLSLHIEGGTAPYVVDPSPLIRQASSDTVVWSMEQAGNADLQLGVTDAHGMRGETVVHLECFPAQLVVLSKSLEVTVGQPYSADMSVSGGVPPYAIANVENEAPMLRLLGGISLGGRADRGEHQSVVSVVDAVGDRASAPFTIKGAARSSELITRGLGQSLVPEENLPGTHSALTLVLTATGDVNARGTSLLRLGNQRNGFNVYHSWVANGGITVEYYARGQVYVLDVPEAGLGSHPKKLAIAVGDGYLSIYHDTAGQASVPTPVQDVIIDHLRADGPHLHGLGVYARRIYGDEFDWINH